MAPAAQLEIHLCAFEPAMSDAWAKHFSAHANVHVHECDILSLKADAILSPANSFGFMDGGIDLAYSHFFGWDLQDRLQENIRIEHDRELAIGRATVIPTHHDKIPFLVSAPTMRVPGSIADTVNVFLAFRAALLAINRSKKIGTLLSPALGTGVGCMPIERAAKQMYAAYREVVVGDVEWRASARGVLQHHARLLD